MSVQALLWRRNIQRGVSSNIENTAVNSFGAVCDQKILVFVLQMEKSNQSTWMR
jgi:hypothetical protein